MIFSIVLESNDNGRTKLILLECQLSLIPPSPRQRTTVPTTEEIKQPLKPDDIESIDDNSDDDSDDNDLYNSAFHVNDNNNNNNNNNNITTTENQQRRSNNP